MADLKVNLTLHKDDLDGSFYITYDSNTILLLDANTPMKTVNAIYDGVCKAFCLGMEFSALGKDMGASEVKISMD